MILNYSNFIQILTPEIIQLWMILTLLQFHPHVDDQNYATVVDELKGGIFHPNIDDQNHPIVDEYQESI